MAGKPYDTPSYGTAGFQREQGDPTPVCLRNCRRVRIGLQRGSAALRRGLVMPPVGRRNRRMSAMIVAAGWDYCGAVAKWTRRLGEGKC